MPAHRVLCCAVIAPPTHPHTHTPALPPGAVLQVCGRQHGDPQWREVRGAAGRRPARTRGRAACGQARSSGRGCALVTCYSLISGDTSAHLSCDVNRILVVVVILRWLVVALPALRRRQEHPRAGQPLPAARPTPVILARAKHKKYTGLKYNANALGKGLAPPALTRVTTSSAKDSGGAGCAQAAQCGPA